MPDPASAHDLTNIVWSGVAAIGAASLSIICKVCFDIYSRISNTRAARRAIAATISGEIGGYLLALRPETAAEGYRALAGLERSARLKKLAAFPPLPTGHPAYDKLADKIGLLPPRLTREVSCIYNVVTGVRIIITHFRTPEFLAADDDYQTGLILQVALAMETYVPPARAMVVELEAIALLPPLARYSPHRGSEPNCHPV